MTKRARVRTQVLEDKPQENLQDQQALEQEQEQEQQDTTESSGELTGDGETQSPPVEQSDKPMEMLEWLVEVNCPTPLARNPVKVRAFDEDGAWSVFCGMNGISDTVHPKTITKAE